MQFKDSVEQDKDKIINGLKEGKTLSEISKEYFGTNSTARINALIDSYGLNPSDYSDRYMYMNETWLREKLNELGSPTKVAEVYSMPRVSVSRYAQRFGLYSPKFSRRKKNSVDNSYFENIDTARKAYWLGFIMADGSIYHYNNDKVQFEIKLQETDNRIIHDFAKDIGFPEDSIRVGVAKRKGTDCNFVAIRVYDKEFCENLMKHGIVDRKSGKEIIPNTVPTEFKKDFIRGFWDGDGSIKEHEISVCSTSFKIMSNLSSWFCHLSIHYTIEQHSNSNIFELKISRKSWKQFLDIVYCSGCFGLQRKVEIANKIRSTLMRE